MAFLTADGGCVPAQVGLAPLVDGGAAASASMVVTNLMERKQAERILANERFTRRLIDSTPLGVAVVDRNLRYLLANSAYAAIVDGAPVVGRTVAEVFPPAVAKTVAPAVQQVLDSGRPAEFREYETPIHGRTWWTVREIPLRDTAGNTEAVLILTEEVTERKLAEQALAAAHRQVQSLINNTPAIVYAFDLEERFLLANTAVAALLNTTPEQMIGRRRHEFMAKEDADWHEANDRKAIEAGRALEFEEYSQLQGRSITWLTTKFPLRDERGRIYAVAGISADVSARKQVEEELKAARLSAEQAKNAADAANKAKNHFLAVLSHELRNPLNPVLATASMLREDPRFDADAREQLEVICRNAELEARLIDDLLDVTRIERGKVELDRRPVELGTILRRAAEVCRPDIEARKLEFGIDASDWPYWVDADAARLQQVFWNLLKNAIKFTPKGGCVGLRCRREDGGSVVVEVNDSGEGIEPEDLGRIFNAFDQVERSITRQFGGLGLGLTISKALVEMHGGGIQAHSAGKGRGATFTVRLPLLPSEAAAPPTPEAPPAPAAIRPLRILLVEDHGDTARIMCRLLSMEGHTVQAAADVAGALALAEKQAFDLLLSDLGLPDGSGLDLMRTLRGKGLKMCGVALSGYGQEQDVEQSRKAGFSAHLTKPVSLPKLKEIIARVAAEGGCNEGYEKRTRQDSNLQPSVPKTDALSN